MIRAAWDRIIQHTLKIPSTLFISDDKEQTLDAVIFFSFLSQFNSFSSYPREVGIWDREFF